MFRWVTCPFTVLFVPFSTPFRLFQGCFINCFKVYLYYQTLFSSLLCSFLFYLFSFWLRIYWSSFTYLFSLSLIYATFFLSLIRYFLVISSHASVSLFFVFSWFHYVFFSYLFKLSITPLSNFALRSLFLDDTCLQRRFYSFVYRFPGSSIYLSFV